VKALTGRLHDRLDAMTPGHESWEEARLVARAAEMIGNADPDLTGTGLYSIAEIRRGIHEGYLWVQQTQPSRTAALRQQIAEYDRALRSSGLRDDQIAHGVAAGGAFATGRKRTALKTVLLAPIALLGLALNLLPFFVLRMLSRRKDLDKRSTWSIFAGFFVFPFFWLVTALAMGLAAAAYGDAATGWICGGVTVLLAPATGRPTLTFLDNAAAIWAETRARVLLRGNSRRASKLTTQRSRIRAELAALSEEYAAFCEQAEG
jgi:hypothetical protein